MSGGMSGIVAAGIETEKAKSDLRRKKARKRALSLITTDKVDGSTLVECLNAVRGVLVICDCIERSEELCRWVKKLEAVGGEK